jgi:hypothetical protein
MAQTLHGIFQGKILVWRVSAGCLVIFKVPPMQKLFKGRDALNFEIFNALKIW